MRTNLLVACVAGAGLLAGCSNDISRRVEARPGAPRDAARSGVMPFIDGRFEDWPADSVLACDELYLYFRFTVLNTEWSLQSSDTPVSFMIDCDGALETGRRFDRPDLRDLGVDLEVQFSPKSRGSRGVACFALDAAGNRTPIAHDDLALTFAPSYASQWYEGRLARALVELPALPEPGLRSSGSARAFACTLDDAGIPRDYSDPTTIACPPVAGVGMPHYTIDLPARPEGAVRVVSMNVERSAPDRDEHRAQFQRLFRALDADVYLLQEWEAPSPSHIAGWFTAMVSPTESWWVLTSGESIASGGGCAIVSRHALEPAVAGVSSDQRPVRFIAGVASTPAGAMLLGSTHLKSRGGLNSPEDERRMDEARAIHAALDAYSTAKGLPPVRVLAGDFNLVGSRTPLSLAGASLDADASNLGIVETPVLGDRVITTWLAQGNEFSPSRLDYLLVSDSAVRALNAFVLDTRRLSDESLARIGLDRTDSLASDHMPVVVDLAPRR